VHYVSTYGIWGLPVPGRDHIAEDDDIAKAGRLVTGYVQSKWAAEHLALQAADRGVDVAIYRLGRVLGDSRTGAALTAHFTCRVIKGCIQLGMAPDHGPSYLNIMPVDWIAKAIVHISRKPEAIGRYFNLGNPNYATINESIGWTQEFGYDVDIVPYDAWREHALRVGPSHALSKVSGLFRPAGVRDWPVDKILMTVDFTNTLSELEGTDIVCPPPEEFVFKSLQWLVDVGFLPTPEEQRRAKPAVATAAAPALAS
jgi:thioester reductase-like protein